MNNNSDNSDLENLSDYEKIFFGRYSPSDEEAEQNQDPGSEFENLDFSAAEREYQQERAKRTYPVEDSSSSSNGEDLFNFEEAEKEETEKHKRFGKNNGKGKKIKTQTQNEAKKEEESVNSGQNHPCFAKNPPRKRYKIQYFFLKKSISKR